MSFKEFKKISLYSIPYQHQFLEFVLDLNNSLNGTTLALFHDYSLTKGTIMEVLSAILLTGLGLFSGIFFIWKEPPS